MPFPLLDEIIEKVFERLDAVDIVKCERVCKRLLGVIRASMYLQYKIDLQAAGYVDNPHSKLPITERHRLLRVRVQYWKTLSWTKPSKFPLEYDGTISWRICRGLLMRFSEPADPIESNPRFQVLDLTGTEPSIVSHNALTFDQKKLIRDHVFIFDPGQDLLLVHQIDGEKTHLRPIQFSEDITHPLSQKPSHLLDGLHPSDDFNFLQIKGHLVSACYHTSPEIALLGLEPPKAGVLIINWVTGEIIDTVQPGYPLTNTFQIYSPDRYLTSSYYSQDPFSSSELCIKVGKIGRKEPFTLLSLPEMYDDWHIEQVFCYCSETWSMERDTFVPYKMPFIPSNEKSIIIYHFLLKALRPATKTFTVVIGPDLISNLTKTHHSSDVVQWKDWGPANTRCFFDTRISTSGSEFVDENCTAKVYHNRFMTATDILDFNQLEIARDLCLGKRRGIISESSVLPADPNEPKDAGVFLEPVVSSLPYRKVPHGINPDPDLLFSRYMLDEHLMTQNVAQLENGGLDWNIVVYH